MQETDIIDLEKRYWILKTQSRSGRLDLETLRPLICPPIPVVLCEGKCINVLFLIGFYHSFLYYVLEVSLPLV